MLILGIDTATPWGTMALVEDETIHFEVSLRKLKGGGEYLLSLLHDLMQQSGKSLSELNLIAIGNGPGSYTGIRVGLAAVSGLAEGLHIPVATFSTLQIIAANARYSNSMVLATINARRNQVYAALYRADCGRLEEVFAPTAMDVEELSKSMDAYASVWVCGDGSKAYQAVWQADARFIIAPSEWDRPLGSQLARLAQQSATKGTLELDGLTPNYLKKVEAEIRLEEKHGLN